MSLSTLDAACAFERSRGLENDSLSEFDVVQEVGSGGRPSTGFFLV